MSLAQRTRGLCTKAQVSMGCVFTRYLSIGRRSKDREQRINTRDEPSWIGR